MKVNLRSVPAFSVLFALFELSSGSRLRAPAIDRNNSAKLLSKKVSVGEGDGSSSSGSYPLENCKGGCNFSGKAKKFQMHLKDCSSKVNGSGNGSKTNSACIVSMH